MLFKFGYRISKVNNSGELVKIHKYKDYNEYRETQIFYNKKKIDKVWADEITLEKISDLKKTTLFGGNEEFKGGLFIKDDRLLFFKNGMYYCSGSYDFWNGLNKCDYFLIDYNLDNSTLIKTYTRNNNNLKKEMQ